MQDHLVRSTQAFHSFRPITINLIQKCKAKIKRWCKTVKDSINSKHHSYLQKPVQVCDSQYDFPNHRHSRLVWWERPQWFSAVGGSFVLVPTLQNSAYPQSHLALGDVCVSDICCVFNGLNKSESEVQRSTSFFVVGASAAITKCCLMRPCWAGLRPNVHSITPRSPPDALQPPSSWAALCSSALWCPLLRTLLLPSSSWKVSWWK